MADKMTQTTDYYAFINKWLHHILGAIVEGDDELTEAQMKMVLKSMMKEMENDR